MTNKSKKRKNVARGACNGGGGGESASGATLPDEILTECLKTNASTELVEEKATPDAKQDENEDGKPSSSIEGDLKESVDETKTSAEQDSTAKKNVVTDDPRPLSSKSVRFARVNVYEFERCQGFSSIPGNFAPLNETITLGRFISRLKSQANRSTITN